MERNCRYVPLSKQPLALVLAQVRFSRVRQMDHYIPQIQEEFRRSSFPIERSGKVQQVTFGLQGPPVQTAEQDRWEYRTKDERWSVLVLEDSLVLQTTDYGRFEDFAEHFRRALSIVLETTEHDRLGVVERIGLRYVDVIQPQSGEDFRQYVRPGLHGLRDEVFQAGTHRTHIESTGQTTVGDVAGTLVVRVAQNDVGMSLPPDLFEAAPRHEPRAAQGELLTLVDMDHFIVGTFDPTAQRIIEKAYIMHDHIIETFHEHVVSEHAIEAWQ